MPSILRWLLYRYSPMDSWKFSGNRKLLPSWRPGRTHVETLSYARTFQPCSAIYRWFRWGHVPFVRTNALSCLWFRFSASYALLPKQVSCSLEEWRGRRNRTTPGKGCCSRWPMPYKDKDGQSWVRTPWTKFHLQGLIIDTCSALSHDRKSPGEGWSSSTPRNRAQRFNLRNVRRFLPLKLIGTLAVRAIISFDEAGVILSCWSWYHLLELEPNHDLDLHRNRS